MQNELYPWHEKIGDQWQTLLKEGRLHHAILLSSPKGSGKRELGARLAKTLLCSQGTSSGEVSLSPCGFCHACRLFEAETHPDFHCIKPEEGKTILGVDLIRKGVQSAWETSILGGARVILIEQADKMNTAAANALLKTLEEPPLQCHFILLADSLSGMLATVLSRCNKWKPSLPDERVVKEWVEAQLMQSVPLQIIRLHRGAPLAAKAFVENNTVVQFDALLKAFSLYLKTKRDLFGLTQQCVNAEKEGLQWLSYFLIDIMKLQEGTQACLVYCDALSTLSNLAKILPKTLVRNQLFSLTKLNAQLIQNPGFNSELLISHWLASFQYET